MITGVLVILGVFLIELQLLPVMGTRPDLLVLATICLGLLHGWKRGLVFGLLSGTLQDIFSSGVLGLFSIGHVVSGLLAGYSRRLLLLRHWIVRVGLVFILTLFVVVMNFLLLTAFHKKAFPGLFFPESLLVPLENSAIAGILFWLMDRRG